MVSGLGFGLVIGPIGASVISSVGPQWMATGSALVTVSRMVGMVVGLSALSSWGVRRFNSLAADITTPIVRPSGPHRRPVAGDEGRSCQRPRRPPSIPSSASSFL